jgi:integrase
MPSLTRDSRGRSPYWICCYTASDGRQLKKSTKCYIKPLPGEKNALGRSKTAQDARQEAMTICLGWQHAEDMAGAGTATEAQVRRVLNEALTRIGAKPVESLSVRQWFESWIMGKTGVVADSTMLAYQQIERDFLKWLGKRADTKIETITAEEITRFRDHLRAQGLSDGTVTKLIRKYLNSPFYAAWRLGKIPVNPCAFVETKVKTQIERPRKGKFTPTQVKELVKAATGDWKGLIMAAYFTGGRLQDLANLQWRNVDRTTKVVRFHQRKTGQEITIPLHPSLEQYFLTSSAPDDEKAFVFPALANHDEGGRNGLSKQFGEILANAKIDNPTIRERRQDSKGRSVKSLTFHSLRHSFTSELADAGVPAELRQQLTGHSDDATHEIYVHHDFERLRAAVAKLPNVGAV